MRKALIVKPILYVSSSAFNKKHPVGSIVNVELHSNPDIIKIAANVHLVSEDSKCFKLLPEE